MVHGTWVSRLPDPHVRTYATGRPILLQLREESEQLGNDRGRITEGGPAKQTTHEAVVLPEPTATGGASAWPQRSSVRTPRGIDTPRGMNHMPNRDSVRGTGAEVQRQAWLPGFLPLDLEHLHHAARSPTKHDGTWLISKIRHETTLFDERIERLLQRSAKWSRDAHAA